MIYGLERFGNIIRVRRKEGEEDLPSLFEPRDGIIYVKALNNLLVHVATDRGYRLD